MNADKEIKTNLELVVRLFITYLLKSSLLESENNITYADTSEKHIELEAKFDSEIAQLELHSTGNDFQVVFSEISKGLKCLVNICDQKQCVKQAILDYKEDLLLGKKPLEFPIFTDEASQLFTPSVFAVFQEKFCLIKKERKSSGGSINKEETMEALEKLKFGSRSRSYNASIPSRPADMPSFDDEYEAQTSRQPIGEPHGLPGLGVPSPAAGYGDSDLYPTGEKYPALQGPQTHLPNFRNPPSRGGMIFNPFQGGGPSSNPLQGGGNTFGTNKDSPPFPSARYDEPFGRMSHQGGGGGFI
ncbi:LAMI_0G11408g1_1 [Lachancea mirantina]|uniref:LAMI_0G11408g1_1 n=1 Tax=Lachancea mirantina TaxID=1230905 RepID=A0A1G4KAY6_9SACH|nr:LAMI_0G11408g1_1 [Lachancea mirantina]